VQLLVKIYVVQVHLQILKYSKIEQNAKGNVNEVTDCYSGAKKDLRLQASSGIHWY